MAILTSQSVIAYADNYRVGRLVYALKNHLVSAGWVVAGSANGTAGGMDGVDRITSWTSLSSTTASWLVLRSPHASASDRIQLLFRTTNTAGNYAQGYVGYDPNSALTSSSTAIPTSPTLAAVRSGYLFTTASTESVRLVMLADNQPPYGFALQCVTVGATSRYEASGIGFVPLSVRNTTSPGKPYVVVAGCCTTSGSFSSKAPFKGSELSNTASTLSACYAEPIQPPKVPVRCLAPLLQDSLGTVMPWFGTSTLITAPVMPTIFIQQGEFIGQSDFMRMNGYSHLNLGLLYNNSGVGDRIVFGDYNFPWDGSLPISV